MSAEKGEGGRENMGVDVWGGYSRWVWIRIVFFLLPMTLPIPPSGQPPGGVERSVSEVVFPLCGGPH